MSLWTDFRDLVESPFKAVGDIVSDAVKAVLHNPIGAITSIVAMEMGIPPVWAGTLSGAASAAATGGNVIKGAFTGGAMGAVGGLAGAAAGEYGAIAQSAAGGAAAAATGAVLTGQDLVAAAKAGLVLGGITGGVAKFMTKAEAASSVPQAIINHANTTADPLGTLVSNMGWSMDANATAAGQAALSQGQKAATQSLAENVPTNVLNAAKQSSDPVSYVQKAMGWDSNGVSNTAAQRRISNICR